MYKEVYFPKYLIFYLDFLVVSISYGYFVGINFRVNYSKADCLKKCLDNAIYKECGCSWLKTTGNGDAPLCGYLPDNYPPDGCIWTDNQTVLENQIKTCLEPLMELNKTTECQLMSFFKFIGKYVIDFIIIIHY